MRLGEVLRLSDEAAQTTRELSSPRTEGREGVIANPSISFEHSTSFSSSFLNSSMNPSIRFSIGATSRKTLPKRRKTSGGQRFRFAAKRLLRAEKWESLARVCGSSWVSNKDEKG